MLIRRQQQFGVRAETGWYVAVIVLDVGAIAAGLLTAVTGAIGFFEWQLLFLLGRPMLAFVLVLGSLRA